MGMAGRKDKDKHRERGTGDKSTSTRKYGQLKPRHSRMGVYSCFMGGGALVLFLICMVTALVMRGKTYPVIGGLGILSLLPAVFGVQAAIKGLREREKRYVTCRVGLAGNIIILLVLVFIFIGGFR